MRISIWVLIGLGLAAACVSAAEKQNCGGAIFVPLDSWVYPALQRVAALGFVPDQNTDMMPWTRAECARQVAEADRLVDAAAESEQGLEARRLLTDLDTEFPPDVAQHDKTLALESVYTGLTGVAGKPLTDSYHFGQSITNNFGRPYNAGFNSFTGVSGYAQYGHFFAYVRGEYQEAPGAAGEDLGVRQFISSVDTNPLQPYTATPAVNRFELLDTYVGAQVGFENISVGKQSFWWGPGQSSAFSLSDNAAPFYTLNLSQSRPLVLPGVLRYLGEMHSEFLFGGLSGHQWPRRPLINAQKISFDITPSLELGFVRSAFWGGVGHPVTAGSFMASMVSVVSTGTTFAYGDRADPGDRHSGFDFRYRVPGLRNTITLYSDSYADDDPNPLGNPSRSAWAPGIYFSHIPFAPHLDLRVETYSTLLYSGDHGGQFIYYNSEYHDAYTNGGNLLGSWIGRDARAYVASAGYWLNGRTRFMGQYRQIKDGGRYLPGGGTQTDGSLYVQWGASRMLLISGSAQLERYYVPVLGPAREDAIAMLSVTVMPHLVRNY